MKTVKVNQREVIEFAENDGETYIIIFASGWIDHFIVVNQNAIEEYDPTIECLSTKQIVKKFTDIKDLEEQLKKLSIRINNEELP
jgi:hypothetical protein